VVDSLTDVKWGLPEKEGSFMFLSQALGWLCEPPRSNFTLRGVLQKGWPEVAGFLAMPKALELGRLARLVERGIFVAGGLADIIGTEARRWESWGRRTVLPMPWSCW
jgi:hypothetical protein